MIRCSKCVIVVEFWHSLYREWSSSSLSNNDGSMVSMENITYSKIWASFLFACSQIHFFGRTKKLACSYSFHFLSNEYGAREIKLLKNKYCIKFLQLWPFLGCKKSKWLNYCFQKFSLAQKSFPFYSHIGLHGCYVIFCVFWFIILCFPMLRHADIPYNLFVWKFLQEYCFE